MKTRTLLLALVLALFLVACGGENPKDKERYTARLDALQDKYCKPMIDYSLNSKGEVVEEYIGSPCDFEYYQKAVLVDPGTCVTCAKWQRHLQCIVDAGDKDACPLW